MEGMKRLALLISFCAIAVLSFAQDNTISTVVKDLSKGSYVILEVRMQLEDEFQTVEGNESANLSRIAVFTGKNTDKEVLSKGFKGYNQVVQYLNDMKESGFELEETYPIKGNSLLITHYVFKKIKK